MLEEDTVLCTTCTVLLLGRGVQRIASSSNFDPFYIFIIHKKLLLLLDENLDGAVLCFTCAVLSEGHGVQRTASSFWLPWVPPKSVTPFSPKILSLKGEGGGSTL